MRVWWWVWGVAAARPGSIVVTVIDDLGWGDVGYNAPQELGRATPTIDRLAAQGVRMDRFYASPTCTASRAALMTGRYPMHLGLQDSVIHPSEPRGVPLEARFLSEKLKDLGYRSALVGKWHLGFHQRAYTPRARGFDTFFGILTGGGDHYSHETTSTFTPRGSAYKGRASVMSGANLWHDDVAVSGEHEGIHTTELYSSRAADLILEEGPLFLMVSYQAVHAPVQAPAREQCRHLLDRSRRAMCAMIRMVDDGIRQLEAALIESGRWDSAAWFVCSDNGGVLRHGSSNGDLRGEKGSYYEGGIRVPAFASGGLARPSLVFDGLVHVTDLHATTLALAGAPDSLIDGLDQSCALFVTTCINATTRTEIVHNVNSDLFGGAGALRVGDFKLVVASRVSESEIYEYGVHMLQDDVWDQAELSQVIHQKLLRSPGASSLFDVSRNPNEIDDPVGCADPAACRDLYDHPDYRDVRLALRARFDDLQPSPSTEQWTDDGPLADPKLFGGVWSPWRDDLNFPYATYQLASDSVHPNLNGDHAPRPSLDNSTSLAPARRRRLRVVNTSHAAPFLRFALPFALGLFLGSRLSGGAARARA